jgi:ribosome-binding factor A
MAVKLSEDSKYVSAFNRALEAKKRAAAYLKDLNKAKPDST